MTEAPNELAQTARPDAGAIARGEGEFRTLVGASSANRSQGFAVVIQQPVLDAIHTHGKSNTKVEICGVLVGRVYHDDAGPYLLIHASIPGTEAHSNAANVTFTSETWTHIHEQMDRLYPDDRIVGWYHTHPGFDIFLSEMDLFIQGNFFDLPWQVAFVYDPLRGDEGMFVWRNGVPTREVSLIEPTETPATEVESAIVDEGVELDRPGKMFAAIVLLFVAALLVLLIVFEYKSKSTKPPEPLSRDDLKWSNVSQWIANR